MSFQYSYNNKRKGVKNEQERYGLTLNDGFKILALFSQSYKVPLIPAAVPPLVPT